MKNSNKLLPVLFIAIMLASLIVVVGVVFRASQESSKTKADPISAATEVKYVFDNVPAFPGSTEQANDGNVAVYSSSDSVHKIVAWYMNQLIVDGWLVKNVPQDPDSTTSQSFDAQIDMRLLNVSVTSDGGTSMIRLTLSEAEEAIKTPTAEELIVNIEEKPLPESEISESEEPLE